MYSVTRVRFPSPPPFILTISTKSDVKFFMSRFIELTCDGCSKIFLRDRKFLNRSKKKYCTWDCAKKRHNFKQYLGKYLGDPPRAKKGHGTDGFTPFRRFTTMLRRPDRSRLGVSVKTKDIKAQWDKQNGICPYTGWVMQLVTGVHNPRKASLDRIDNSKGYHLGNIQFVSHMANMAKWAYSEQQLLEFCKAVTSHKVG